MHTITESPILKLKIFRPSIFKDHRGEYTETYNQKEILPYVEFKQDSAILSTKGVLRGYHGDFTTTKLITCLQGAFQIVVLNINPVNESSFMKYETFILDDKERLSLEIPSGGYVNAHQCLTDTCLFFYKQNTFYRGEKYQYTIKWDTIGGVVWPLKPILSYRDASTAKNFTSYINFPNKDSYDGATLKLPEEVNR